MTNRLLRTAAILLHGIINFLLINWLMNYDITGSWLTFTGFILVVMILLYFFIRHLVSYFYFIKTSTK